MTTSFRTSLVAALLLLPAAAASQAETHAGAGGKPVVVEQSQPPSSSWWLRAAPYAWLTTVDGDMTLGGIEAPVDVSFADTLDSLDMTAMGVVEAGYDRWGLGVDVIYAKFSDDSRLRTRLFDSVRLEQKQWQLTPRLSYRVIQTADYSMDVMAGARWTSLDLDFTLRGARGAERTLGGGRDWWDPVVGVRGRALLGDALFLDYSALVGGFGLSSDLLWDAFLGFGYRITPNFAPIVGYRGLGVDYTDGGFGVDSVTHGLLLGLELKF